MVYRFSSPGRGPQLPMGEAPGHKIAGTILDLKRQAIQRERLAQERLLAEERARQFGLQQDADKAAADAAAKRWAEKFALDQRKAATGEGRLDLGRRQFGLTASEKARQARMSLRPEYAREVEGLTVGLGLTGPLGMRAQQAEQRRKAGAEPTGPVLGEETIEFDVALGELEQTLEPLLESSDPVEQQAAAMAREQLPGWLKQYGGDKEKAGQAARAFIDGKVQEAGKDRRAAEVTKRQQAQPFDSLEPERGRKAGLQILEKTGGITAMEDFKAINGAITVLEEAKKTGNPMVLNSTNLLAVQAMTGQEGRALSNQDFNQAVGESWFQDLRKMVSQKVLGQADLDKIDRTIDALKTGMKRATGKLDSSLQAFESNVAAMGSAGAEGTAYHRAMGTSINMLKPYIDWKLAQEQRKKKIESLKTGGAPPEPEAPVDGLPGLIENAPQSGSGMTESLGTTDGRVPKVNQVPRRGGGAFDPEDTL